MQLQFGRDISHSMIHLGKAHVSASSRVKDIIVKLFSLLDHSLFNKGLGP